MPPPPNAMAGSKSQFSRKILVMGLTGAGKSTFINTVAGSTLTVSASIESCTQIASHVSFYLGDGIHVELMDSPGFNDSVWSELQVLQSTVNELQSWAPEGIHAIIYLQRISDNRISGSALRAFDIFFKMCGATGEVMTRVAIVTNMWDAVSLEVGEAREAELKYNGALSFKKALDLGASFHRNNNPPKSALEIIHALVGRESPFSDPLKLAVQCELEGGLSLHQTSAGEAISHELSQTQAKHQAEIIVLRQQYEKARQDHDIETQEEIEEERRLILESLMELELIQAHLREQVEQKTFWTEMEQVTYGRLSSQDPTEPFKGQSFWDLVLNKIRSRMPTWRNEEMVNSARGSTRLYSYRRTEEATVGHNHPTTGFPPQNHVFPRT
ncbi:50S ribosome-binding GTPase [Rhizoctonia solani 123E]|uniref:50S ribosome-binding GTPase n=1 Tax=Rhizoctonia solani 123E TaxID=1423351 RepID=A0A074RT55_9AGAM|nr:50S ribosome-binding GTPase [Rhizoctonia solani 123E]